MNKLWVNHQYNFDNIPNALLTLFVISTYDNWGVMLKIAQNSDSELIVFYFFLI